MQRVRTSDEHTRSTHEDSTGKDKLQRYGRRENESSWVGLTHEIIMIPTGAPPRGTGCPQLAKSDRLGRQQIDTCTTSNRYYCVDGKNFGRCWPRRPTPSEGNAMAGSAQAWLSRAKPRSTKLSTSRARHAREGKKYRVNGRSCRWEYWARCSWLVHREVKRRRANCVENRAWLTAAPSTNAMAYH